MEQKLTKKLIRKLLNKIKIILLHGPPAGGKGMQQDLVEKQIKKANKDYVVATFDMGTRLREISKDENHLLANAFKEFTSRGESVPLDLICEVWKEFFNTIPENTTHIVLAGTVRLVDEVTEFLNYVSEFAEDICVIEIDVPEVECRQRIKNRFMEENRTDDENEIAVNERFRVYHQKTIPALYEFQQQQKNFSQLRYFQIDGNVEPQKVLQNIIFCITKKPLQVTLHGDNGSGKSTIVELMSLSTGFTVKSSGAKARQLAEEAEVTIETAAATALENKLIPNFDLKIDTWIKEQGADNRFVMDTRLGFHFIPNSYKVRLQLPSSLASEWIWKNPKRRVKETAKTIEELRELLKQRFIDDKNRYQNLYGVDIGDKLNYDLIVDMSLYEDYQIDAERYILNNFLLWLLQ